MKLKIFHTVLSVALFCVLTVIFTKSGDGSLSAYPIAAEVSDIESTVTGDGFKCIGEPVSAEKIPKRVRAGDETVIAFKGEPYTVYGIKVYYPSEMSLPDASVAVKSNREGIFEYRLKISEEAAVGRLKLTVLGESTYFLAELEIIE